MSLKQHFIVIKTNEKISRKYGGSNYELAIYENKGIGNLVYIGQVLACTRAHRGEIFEAWTRIIELKALKPNILKAITKADKATKEIGSSYLGYYMHTFEEKFGVKLTGFAF